MLTSYYGCSTRAEWGKWKRDTVEAVIERAKVDPTLLSYPGIEEGAVCPLCGDGTSAFGARGGFASPGGVGTSPDGLRQYAPVLGTAFKLSAESLHDTLLASDRAEKEREQERRQSEPMVRHAAQAPPAFLYQTEWRGPARGEAKMGDSEQRLRDLGFEIIVEGNVRTYRFVQDDWLVLADPRVANKIEFEVTSLSKPKKSRSIGAPTPSTCSTATRSTSMANFESDSSRPSTASVMRRSHDQSHQGSEVEQGSYYEKTGMPGSLRMIVHRHGDKIVYADFTGLTKCWASTSARRAGAQYTQAEAARLFPKEVADIARHLEAR
ncbi:hypothetical protein [Bradyrhizobium sp. SSUT77]|uniref:hypothetical protein n=1 Tax=Bradyrhizobium sp. SSUT77 TaxID=3040603 RepID=UPI00244D26DA|nr:hypothetical protein [Bradyrhizobium sp. SSUT77]MDH2348147.1 hypothetical protein [Bradyrhizobium sp. SSUT77]